MKLRKMWMFALIGVAAWSWPAAAKTVPVDLTGGANTAFRDEVPDDRAGGWTDQGSNDLRLLPAGDLKLQGVTFRIADDAATGGKSCIVVSGAKERDYLPREARVELGEPASGKVLYLLHAGAWLKGNNSIAGRLTVEYGDGASQEWRIRAGRDVADWWKNRGVANAFRVWSVYNNNSQVSLYASMFELADKPVRAIRFDAGDDAVWMIAGAAIGDKVKLRDIYVERTISGEYPVPEPVDAAELAADPRGGVPKNIILIIGDGMGQGAVKYTGLHVHGQPQKLVMEQLPVQGMTLTRSANNEVTDSAASGTALSSGYKTNNGFLGMTPAKAAFRSIAEEARDSGRAIGIVTTDHLTGATPAAFFAHVPARGMYPEIADFAAESRFDILIGNNQAPFIPQHHAGSQRKDDRDLCEEFLGMGYTRIDGLDSFRAATGLPVYGFISVWIDDTRLLAAIAEESFRKLSRNPNGFFMMIEGHFPDAGGHGNDPDKTVNGTLMVDFTVKAALDFARKNHDTLIVVTADHETGGLHCVPNPAEPRQPFVHYTTSSHTGAPVNVFAYGPGADRFAGVLDNTEIPAVMAALWELPLHCPYQETADAP